MGENQYVVFNLDLESYAIEILKVHEVDRLKEISITKVPRVPDFVDGIINLRGEVVPIINLRRKLGLNTISLGKEARILVVNVLGKMVGLLVDAVNKVTMLEEEEIVMPPEDVKINCEYIRGIGRKKDQMIFLLDIDKVFYKEEGMEELLI